MMICPHCGIYMKPFSDGHCEFCGKDLRKKLTKKQIRQLANKSDKK